MEWPKRTCPRQVPFRPLSWGGVASPEVHHASLTSPPPNPTPSRGRASSGGSHDLSAALHRRAVVAGGATARDGIRLRLFSRHRRAGGGAAAGGGAVFGRGARP